MKKILFLIFSLFFLMLVPQAKETLDTFHSIFHYKYHYVDNHGRFGDFEIIQRDLDGAYAFCIEPGMPLTQETYQGYQGLSNEELASKVGITPKQLQDISLYAYFGYLFEDHSDSSWLVAVQTKIWQLLGREFQFTSRNKESNPYQYVIETPFEIQDEMNALEQLKEAYYNPPVIEDFTMTIGEEKIITDFAFYDFELVSDSPNIEKKGHQIFIHATEKGDFEFTLRRRFLNYPTSYFVYHKDNGQDLFVGGNIPEIIIPIHYSVKGNEIILEKKDATSKECQKEFDKAIYSLYQEDGTFLLDTKLTNCQAKIQNLKEGKYYFIEKESPISYELDLEKHPFEISKNQTDPIYITVLEKKIVRKLQIHKDYLDQNWNLHSEANATFEIYKKESLELLMTLTTDENGNAEANLEYGDYYLKQINGKENYKFIEKKEFSIKQEDCILNLENEPYTKAITIQKIDSKTKKPILLEGIAFELIDRITNQKICQNQECLFYTNKEGQIIIPNLLYSTYELKEIPQKIKGYLTKEEPLQIIVNQSSPLYYEFENEPRTISVQIIKYKNEQNKKTTLEENAEFQIYQSEKLIATLTTNAQGMNTITLPYGTYKIIQTKGDKNYHLIEDKEIILDETSNDNIVLELINQPILKNIKILKKDSLTKERVKLPHIKFELYDRIHQEKICLTPSCLFETNEQGEIDIVGLYYSTYELRELPSFIKGYAYQTEPLIFTLDDNSSKTTTLDFYNTPIQGKIHISKRNEKEEPLENVTFQIMNDKLQKIDEVTTSKDGCIDIYLNLGTYYIQEISTLSKYNLDNKIYKVVLTQESSSENLVIQNMEFINYSIPNTFKNDSYTFLILFLLGGIFYVKKKHHYN